MGAARLLLWFERLSDASPLCRPTRVWGFDADGQRVELTRRCGGGRSAAVRHWDPDGPPAPVGGVPAGCRAVPLVEVVERDGELVEVSDRRRRRKTNEVVLVRDPAHPPTPPSTTPSGASPSAPAVDGGRPSSVATAAAFDVALSLVRGHVVHLACEVDSRGNVGEPRWWQPTKDASAAAAVARSRTAEVEHQRELERGVARERARRSPSRCR